MRLLPARLLDSGTTRFVATTRGCGTRLWSFTAKAALCKWTTAQGRVHRGPEGSHSRLVQLCPVRHKSKLAARRGRLCRRAYLCGPALSLSLPRPSVTRFV